MKPDEKLTISEKMKIDQKEFDVLKENQMVKLLIEVEKMSSTSTSSTSSTPTYVYYIVNNTLFKILGLCYKV